MSVNGHDRRQRIRGAGRLLASRLTLWALAKSGDPLSSLLRTGPGEDVYALFERMRARGPVHRSRTGAYVVTSHALCNQVLRDPRFRVRDRHGRPADLDPSTSEGEDSMAGSFLEQDPPDHTRLRRLVAPAFRPKLVRGYRSRVEVVANDLLDRAARRGSFDLISDFAAPLPITVITELLGIPDVDVDRFARLGAVVGHAIGGVFSARQAEELQAANDELTAMFITLERGSRHEPGDDVLGILAAARAEDRLTLEELVGACGLLLIAGFETTVNLIGNAIVALAGHPDQWQLLGEEPSRAAAAVEETLRWDPPVQLTVRIPHEPVELAGHRVGPDAKVMLILAAANRDPEVYPDPERFDISRVPDAEHLAFSSGIHYCLGAQLARLEGEVALQTLARRLPDLHLTGSLRRRPGSAIRGFANVPLAALSPAGLARVDQHMPVGERHRSDSPLPSRSLHRTAKGGRPLKPTDA
ncbi:MAG: cytochrome P450 [Pseudonocardia sp.]